MNSLKHNIEAPVKEAAPAVPFIRLSGVRKVYGGRFRRGAEALRGLDLEIRAGEVTGIAGPNGAGKSTLLSLVGGFIAPTAGTLTVGGLPPAAYVRRRGLGYLPELVRLPAHWTAEGALLRLGALEGLRGPALARRAGEALAELGLEKHADTPAGKLSKGNLQRLGLAQLLLADRDLLIFDEPSNGLDPVWLMRFRSIVRGLRRPGRAILVASHNLDELERLTDSVVILGGGRVEKVFRPEAAHESGAVFRLRLLRPFDRLAELFPGAAPAEGRPGEYIIEAEPEALNAGLRRLLEAGGALLSLRPEQGGLERAFARTVEGEK
jgi:ABC-2 type transport system ATP-binding protein